MIYVGYNAKISDKFCFHENSCIKIYWSKIVICFTLPDSPGYIQAQPGQWQITSSHTEQIIKRNCILVALHNQDMSPAPKISDDVDRKSTRLNSSHVRISYAVFCLK